MKQICFIATLGLLAAATACKPGQSTTYEVKTVTLSCGFEPHEAKLNQVVFMQAKDKSTGRTLFGLALYGSEIGMKLSPKGILEVNGKRVKTPPSDGFVYIISPRYELNKTPVTADEILSLGDRPFETDLWKNRFFPMVQRLEWRERLD